MLSVIQNALLYLYRSIIPLPKPYTNLTAEPIIQEQPILERNQYNLRERKKVNYVESNSDDELEKNESDLS